MDTSIVRRPDQLRPVAFHPGYQAHPVASVLVEIGGTRVVCAVSVQPGAPRWMREQGLTGGWITSEYAMLPSSTAQRKERPDRTGRTDARALEIQRLIGRSLTKLGDVSIYVDCDVLDADGGTRCASVCGGAVALHLALQRLQAERRITVWPMRQLVAAVSVGIVNGEPVLDLDYALDVKAEVDMNVVMTEGGEYVEVQGTGEHGTFNRRQLDAMLALADRGIGEIIAAQKRVLGVG